ncbi:hypothetical protein JNUCC1_03380 [Lentibacillus sp. JNUCC-1]|uniref:hypothetical protein n=1 Tax=Lentibacillus sp. JNUCC-1 TaxID=2654513 RepID=UPI0012E77881|nr:hypothetical protein [Lentibacillus sp. JNUCC-1]MUV39502.1 hypothetical protein [Lentibacillus sp. JNUCC-1]
MMNENIRKVRKSIENRKKQRKTPGSTNHSNAYRMYASLPQEEEKHGYFPLFPSSSSKQRKKGKDAYITGFILKGVLALGLFLSTALIMETEKSMFTEPKQWTSSALSQEFPFARVNQWYQESFGTPLAFESKKVTDNKEMALPAGGMW